MFVAFLLPKFIICKCSTFSYIIRDKYYDDDHEYDDDNDNHDYDDDVNNDDNDDDSSPIS